MLTGAGFDREGGTAALTLCCDAITIQQRESERRDGLRGELPAIRERLNIAEDEHRVASERLTSLLARARADTGEEYLVAVKTAERRAELQDRVEELRVELAGRFGNADAVRAARHELTEGDLNEWEQKLRETGSQLVDAKEHYDDAVRTHQDALRTCQELERSADVAVLSLAVEALRSELGDAIEDWTVAALAHRGVDSTLRRFETERQPEVVLTAAEAFDRITNGRYIGLVPEDGTLRVLMPGGAGIDASRLSKGATEQLYLAMRFGLARQYARSTPLPLVLDDVLVNADPLRRRALAEELLVVAAELQVILFTCHTGTAELLADIATEHPLAGSANVVQMPG